MTEAFSPDELIQFVSQFRELDINNTGKLDRRTIAQILRSEGEQLEQLLTIILFEKFDKDGNGYIDFNEFLDFCKHLKSKSERDLLSEVFRIADVDNSGYLDLEEVHRMGQMMGLDVSKSDAYATLTALDANSDNRVDLKEFLSILG